MLKNVASQSVTLYAVNISTGDVVTGDAANQLFYVSKDDGTVTLIASNSGVPTEVDSTNAKGLYLIALSQAETNADKLLFSGKSSTANVILVPTVIYTDPANYTTLVVNGSGQVTFSNTTLSGAVGSVTGAVGSVTGAVGSVTGAVGSVTGNVGGNVVGSVGSISGISFPTNFGALAITVGGAVTVGTNNDKTGYTASTVSDKTGYSLSQTFPTNFSSLAIDTNGRVKIQSAVIKNTAKAAFEFVMYSSADHLTPTAGLTVTAQRSIDGGAFAGCANSASGVANGVYAIDLAATDLNGDVITLTFTALGADPTIITILTTP